MTTSRKIAAPLSLCSLYRYSLYLCSLCLCSMLNIAVAVADTTSVPDEILGANGLFFDAENRLYVASVAAAQLLVLDRDSGDIVKVFDENNGVLSPDDVTIDSEGTAYVTNILQGTITAVAPDGTFTDIANLGRGVNPITVGADGSLWVARDFLGEGLYRIDPDRSRPPKTVIAKPGWINGMDFGPDGMLYGPRFKPPSIVRIDPATGAATTVFANFDSEPYALKFNSKGQLHVLEGMPGRVLRVDLDTGKKEMLARYAPGLDNLAFDADDRLFVSSFYDGSIHEVMSDGSLRELRAPSARLPRMLAMWMLAALAIIAMVIVAIVFVIRRLRKQ